MSVMICSKGQTDREFMKPSDDDNNGFNNINNCNDNNIYNCNKK